MRTRAPLALIRNFARTAPGCQYFATIGVGAAWAITDLKMNR